jgi:hypothetical protein
MHSTTIFLLAVGLLATVAMARPGKRPGQGHHHGHGGNGKPHGNGNKWSVVELPQYIRLPRQLAEKLEQPRATFTAKKILDGKYLIISPALIFKLKDSNNDTITTTEGPEIEDTTTDEPSAEETTTPTIDEDSTTPESEEEEESTTPTPSFFKKRSFEIDDDEQFLFPDD